jgi:hypothetical protein
MCILQIIEIILDDLCISPMELQEKIMKVKILVCEHKHMNHQVMNVLHRLSDFIIMLREEIGYGR